VPSALDSKIAQVAATRLCRFCGHAVPADAVICTCRVERGELPHTEWLPEVKQLLIARSIERRMWGGSEHEMWERLLVATFGGTMQGVPPNHRVLKHEESPIVLLPFAAGEAALWVKSGSPTLYTI